MGLDQKLELQEKEFEMKYYKDDELKKAAESNAELTNENTVLKKENEMLDRVVEINKDVIDVKSLVTDLIKKLPEINISKLSVSSNDE